MSIWVWPLANRKENIDMRKKGVACHRSFSIPGSEWPHRKEVSVRCSPGRSPEHLLWSAVIVFVVFVVFVFVLQWIFKSHRGPCSTSQSRGWQGGGGVEPRTPGTEGIHCLIDVETVNHKSNVKAVWCKTSRRNSLIDVENIKHKSYFIDACSRRNTLIDVGTTKVML